MKKFLFIILLLGVVGYFGYNYYMNNKKEETLIEKLKNNSNYFDISIFHDAKFMNLQEHTVIGSFGGFDSSTGNKDPFQADKALE